MSIRRIGFAFWLVLATFTAGALFAADPGQADLDKAVDTQVAANSADDLAEVIRLIESAVEKGLGDDNKKFADQLLASSLTLRGELYAAQIFTNADPRWQRLREMALADLNRAVTVTAATGKTYVTIARLQALPGGDQAKALEAAGKAIEAGDEDSEVMLRAYVIRAELSKDPAQKLADLNKAAELDPSDSSVLQIRGAYYLDRQEYDKAVADFTAAIEIQPEDPRSYHALGIAQVMSNKVDDAIKSFSKAIELAPDNVDFLAQRARAYTVKQDDAAALADLDRALEVDPINVAVLLLRAANYAQSQKDEKALADIEEALRARPDYVPAVQMKALLLVRMKSLPAGIAKLEEQLKESPGDVNLLTQLGILYNANEQPDKAIETFSELLKSDPKNSYALQARADAYLTQGKHQEAIADYNVAIEASPEDSGILNNLAWVLATSPNDGLRDAQRAVELATKAAEVTEYKQAHILSTLAAAYAESGDFSKAIEWSKKAVDISTEALKEPLKKELASYEAGKPWREVKTGEAAPAE